MARNYSLAIATAAVALFPTIGSAQGNMDIGIFHNDGNLEVKVRPTSEFDGVFSSVVFTVRWDRASDLVLGNATTPDGAPINTRRSGILHEDGMFNYLVFAGFGFDEMAASGLRWEAGQEYTILNIPVEGKGVVELVNDEWTGVPTNNADYYVSLGGHDKTGSIYKSMAATTDLEGTVMIKPNPNEGVFQFSFVSTDAVDLRVDVVNTLGQSSFTQTLRGFEGTYVKDMDLTHMSEGIYYLKITRGDKTSVHKIVYH
ncbi:MAG: T9SS type A sorting domain-containing protein [Flavobacteriales bacterium]|nr:T9SS type A sorting domain-containing protein [Flavobacteriales bacterium]